MALPVVVGTAFGALSAANRTRALAWLSNATSGAVSTVQQAIDYARKNPLSSALVVEALVRVGSEVAQFAPFMGKGEQSESLLTSLQKVYDEVVKAEDAQNKGLQTGDDDIARDKIRQDLGRVLVRAFGSLENARKVQVALGTLNEHDFQWLKTVGLPRA